MKYMSPLIQIYDLITDAEQILLDGICETAEKGIITLDEASSIAKDFLTLLPVTNHADLCQKLQQLSDLHPTCNHMYLAYASVFEKNTAQKKATILHDLLDQHAVEKAYSLYRGGVL